MIGVAVIESAFDGRRYGDEIMLWVNEEHRQKSIGRRMFAMAQQVCANMGCVSFKASAPLDAPHVAKMFLDAGYTPVETVFSLKLDPPSV